MKSRVDNYAVMATAAFVHSTVIQMAANALVNFDTLNLHTKWWRTYSAQQQLNR